MSTSPGQLAAARHIAHAGLVLGTVVAVIVAGFFHCVRGGKVSNGWGFVLTEKTRWGFHDQFVNLNTVSTWDVGEHRATLTALLRDGWVTVNEPSPEPSGPSNAWNWCFHTPSSDSSGGGDACFDSISECGAARKHQRSTSKCFQEVR